MGVTDERDTPTGCSEETPVAALRLSHGTASALSAASLRYVGQILALPPGDLERRVHLTREQVGELHASLIEHGCMDATRPLGPFGGS